MEKWDAYWSLLSGDEHGEWLDSKLTPLGKDQVRRTGSNVLLPMAKQLGMLPHVFFSSPMRRCLETFIESWTPVLAETQELPAGTKISTRIIEGLRETLGSHTCDKRVAHSMAVDEYQDFSNGIGPHCTLAICTRLTQKMMNCGFLIIEKRVLKWTNVH